MTGTTQDLDAFYTAGRVLPHLTAPRSSTSQAVPVVTAACALLMDASAGDVLGAEVFKALLMAGADRVTRNSSTDNLALWTATSSNGLDPRFGAGQLNIANSYALLSGGARHSVEDGGGMHPLDGFDHDAAFGGAAGSNASATYLLTSPPRAGRLAATLAWPASIDDSSGPFDAQRTLDNFDLELIDVSSAGSTRVASSMSSQDNTENLWTMLSPGRTYVLNVINAQGVAVAGRYALAWRFEADGDGDGLADRFETGACPDPDDADSDDDGLSDGLEDADGDGLLGAQETDPCDADSDDDGVQDGTELGGVTAVADPEGDGPLAGTNPTLFIADADPLTTTDPRKADSDGDGSSDGIEDSNANGRVDAGESDPNDVLSLPSGPALVPLPPWAPGALTAALLCLALRRMKVKAGAGVDNF